jgi:hypothetical protein
LIAGDITVGKVITVIYDGTQFQTSDALVPISTGVSGSTLTGALTVTGVATAANGTSGSQVVNYSQFAPLVATPGRITLPGGILVQWGNDGSAVGNRTITFSPAFSGTPYTIIVCIKDDPLGGGGFVAAQVGTAYSNVSFTAVTTNPSTGALAAANFFWFAIGPA